MDIQYIPKSFWHSLSVAVIVVSVGLTYIAYRSGSVSIELANAKINLSSEVASSTIALSAALDDAKRAKEEAEKKYDEITAINQILQKKLEELEKTASSDEKLRKKLDDFKELYPTSEPLPPKPSFDDFDRNLFKAEQSLKNLESLNKQIQPM